MTVYKAFSMWFEGLRQQFPGAHEERAWQAFKAGYEFGESPTSGDEKSGPIGRPTSTYALNKLDDQLKALTERVFKCEHHRARQEDDIKTLDLRCDDLAVRLAKVEERGARFERKLTALANREVRVETEVEDQDPHEVFSVGTPTAEDLLHWIQEGCRNWWKVGSEDHTSGVDSFLHATNKKIDEWRGRPS